MNTFKNLRYREMGKLFLQVGLWLGLHLIIICMSVIYWLSFGIVAAAFVCIGAPVRFFMLENVTFPGNIRIPPIYVILISVLAMFGLFPETSITVTETITRLVEDYFWMSLLAVIASVPTAVISWQIRFFLQKKDSPAEMLPTATAIAPATT